MTRAFILILLVISIAACSGQKTSEKIEDLPMVSVQGTRFFSPYCIYLLEEEDSISSEKLEKLVVELLPDFSIVDSLSDDDGKKELMFTYFSTPEEDYPAPDLEYLSFSSHGLTDQQKELLQNPARAVLLVFSGTNQNVIADQMQINQVVHSLVEPFGSAVVLDNVTMESFSSEAWETDRMVPFQGADPDITSQITIHFYREVEYCREITLGMSKFCLPDISIQNVSCNDGNSFGNLINLVAQTWLESPQVREDTTLVVDIDKLKNDGFRNKLNGSLEEKAEKRALIHLDFVLPQEGDDLNQQYEIVFKNEDYSSVQEEQTALISKLFGSSDAIDFIKHDEEILAASERAKQKLPELRELFNAGLPPGQSILLKAPFETDNGSNEWMWVEVTTWNGDKVKGILQNEPFEVSGLSAGAIVSFSQTDAFDYIHYFADGTSEGNETGKIIGANN